MEIEVVPGLMGDGGEVRALDREEDVSSAREGIDRIPLGNSAQIDDLRQHIVITAPVLVEDGVGRIDLSLNLLIGIDIARSWRIAASIENDLNGDPPPQLRRARRRKAQPAEQGE